MFAQQVDAICQGFLLVDVEVVPPLQELVGDFDVPHPSMVRVKDVRRGGPASEIIDAVSPTPIGGDTTRRRIQRYPQKMNVRDEVVEFGDLPTVGVYNPAARHMKPSG